MSFNLRRGDFDIYKEEVLIMTVSENYFKSMMERVLGSQIEYNHENDIVFAHISDFWKFYGFANINNSPKDPLPSFNPHIPEKYKKEAEKRLYDEAWRYYQSLELNKDILGKQPMDDLKRFEKMLS